MMIIIIIIIRRRRRRFWHLGIWFLINGY
jgi:hypothetical protein